MQGKQKNGIDRSRRRWLIATSVAGGMGGVAAAMPFVGSLAPSERARAAGAPVEADIGALKAGEMMTVAWRGKPVWVIRRTDQMLAEVRRADAQVARFQPGPQPNLPNDWPGGWLCPCHGSTFDLAGRVFKNKPAPQNLDVPRYMFLSPTRIVIGKDEQGEA